MATDATPVAEKLHRNFLWRRFSLGGLLVFVTLAAVVFSWISCKRQQAERQRQAAKAIVERGGVVRWHSSAPSFPAHSASGSDAFDYVDIVWLDGLHQGVGPALWYYEVLRSGRPGLIDLSNIQAVDALMMHLIALDGLEELRLGGTRLNDAGMKKIARLKQLRRLSLAVCEITDEGLEYLSELSSLDELDLSATRISDNGIRWLRRLDRLGRLSLNDTAVTDAALHELAMLRNLRWLSLYNTQVTDAGLEHLQPPCLLERLDLHGTHATVDGVMRVKSRLPKCVIHH